jgi:hypothetical protein
VTSFFLVLIAYALLTNMLAGGQIASLTESGFDKSSILCFTHKNSTGPALRVILEIYPRTSVSVFGMSTASKIDSNRGVHNQPEIPIFQPFGDMAHEPAIFVSRLAPFLFSACKVVREEGEKSLETFS